MSSGLSLTVGLCLFDGDPTTVARLITLDVQFIEMPFTYSSEKVQSAEPNASLEMP